MVLSERAKVYYENSIARRSFKLLLIEILYFDRNDGFHFWIYLLHVVPLLPIIINTAIVNRTINKQLNERR